jgi:hypothetical protein
VLGDGGGQRGERGLEGKILGASGVDAAEERVDEPVDDLDAEPRADVLGDRCVRRLEGPGRLGPGARDALGGDDAGGGQLVDVGGNPHELPARQRAHRAPGIDRGRRDAGRDEVGGETRRVNEPDAFGAAGEQRLGPLVHRHPGDIGRRQLPADSW